MWTSIHPDPYLEIDISPMITDKSEHALYPLTQFLTDIGGSLGLFLGVSIFSVYQFIILCPHGQVYGSEFKLMIFS